MAGSRATCWVQVSPDSKPSCWDVGEGVQTPVTEAKRLLPRLMMLEPMIRYSDTHIIKICGITNAEDADMIVDAGANALGFVFVPTSSRYIDPTDAAQIARRMPPHVLRIGLFVNAPLSLLRRITERCELTHVQLHGDESPAYCDRVGRPVLKAFRVRSLDSLRSMSRYRVCAYLLDAYVPGKLGGTGQTFRWEYANAVRDVGPIVLAGGLTPENVGDAIAQARPYGVDVSSGVERSPGRKDPQKVQAFVQQARMAWDEHP